MKFMLVRLEGKLKFSLIKSRHRACLTVAKATFKNLPPDFANAKPGEKQNNLL
ncbi:hypothetical protein [Bacillus atrophaeus]|uniref:hypothetical protein n=1 Tax=Bacillus atrophaeus TaxID=1452 RepID=UPI00138F932D|nr:hypothetical protein [Bacillus atrophaeus]MED4806320.1 hypothetical protein [Bacillus atrophaeus]